MGRVGIGLAGFWFILTSPAFALWVDISRTLSEPDIRQLAVHPAAPAIVWAASEKRVFRSLDGGQKWRQSIGVRSSDRIHALAIDASDPALLYLGTEKGLRLSVDGGKHWKPFWSPGAGPTAVYAAASHRALPGQVWLGTAQGLYQLNVKNGSAARVSAVPAVPVQAILFDEQDPGRCWIASDKGIYLTEDAGAHWHLYAPMMRREREAATSLEQFSIEELAQPSAMMRLAWTPDKSRIIAATSEGLFEADPARRTWIKSDGQDIAGSDIRALAGTPTALYVGTDRGVFEQRPDRPQFIERYEGLPSKEVRALAYEEKTGALYAATPQGVYRWQYPDAGPTPVPISIQAPSILQNFQQAVSRDPSVAQVQAWAIEYAEVHPDKIAQWRRSAARRAWLPKLSMGSSLSDDQNIDLDRGGTNDPDRFIEGPNEKSLDWSVDLSWDLGELVWNGDQTSIDARSRLMVELRQDVLGDVTHLYFERRRLQMQSCMAPAADEGVRLEREIRMAELEAGIDALTGGRFSKALAKARP